MIIKKINLVNFRNLKKEQISFDRKVNIFIGDNAQGKTNILESVYFLALTKSYRTNDINLINKDVNFTKVKGEIKDNSISKTLSVEIIDNQKKVRLNNNEIDKISDYITNLNVILVSPEDINILQGTPAERRNFLNIELSQLSKNYIKKYNEFNKILKIRNNYLKMLSNTSISDKRYLDSLTENLIEREIDIYQERNKFINLINNSVGKIYEDIMGIKEFKIIYEPNIELDNYETEYLKSTLEKKYNNSLKKEIENGMTLYGPHRDDLIFLIGNDDIKLYGSQGQQKLSILSLKLAEVLIFKKQIGEYPILLLDDLFSEFDKEKINNILKYINDDMQVVITTTDIKNVRKSIIDMSKVFYIENGTILEK